MSRPNILLITTDQQRWDALGMNGNRVLQTPNLDALARNGMNFTRAYTTCPSCIAARRTILTGQAPKTHGLMGYHDGLQFDPPFTLPGLLGAAGYQTQLVGKLHMYPQRKRYGFDHLILSETPSYRPESAWFAENDYIDWLRAQGVSCNPNAHGINGNGRLARPFQLLEEYHHTSWVVEEAVQFLTKRRDPSCPWFLHLSLVAPHPPLVPPQAYYDRYKDRTDLRPHLGEWAPQPADDEIDAGVAADSATGPFRAEEIRNAIAGYYGLINHIDDRMFYLFDRLFPYGGGRSHEPVWIIFTSDHGEMLGDHHLFRKSLPYEGSAHIPFFITGRNVPLPRQSSDALVCLEDLLPTCCDLAGISIPAGVDGHSLAPLLRGEAAGVREEIHGEHSGGSGNHFLVAEGHKYVWFTKTNEEQLFDLTTDPYETRDLSGDVARLAPFRQRMQGQMRGRTDDTYEISALRPLANRPPTVFWKDAAVSV